MSRRPGDRILKDPDSIEQQGFDWTAYLAELGDTISTSTFTVSGSGLTLSSPGIVTGNLKTVVTLTGGTLGSVYTVTNRIVTSSGVTDDRHFKVIIRNR